MTMSADLVVEKWPSMLALVRHGESEANVRKNAAKAQGLEPQWTGTLRDQDSPLTLLGHQQAYSLGVMIGLFDDTDLPKVIITSPYLRAKQTTADVVRGIRSVRPGYNPKVVVEERIREIDFGVMDGIDRQTFRELFPLAQSAFCVARILSFSACVQRRPCPLALWLRDGVVGVLGSSMAMTLLSLSRSALIVASRSMRGSIPHLRVVTKDFSVSSPVSSRKCQSGCRLGIGGNTHETHRSFRSSYRRHLRTQHRGGIEFQTQRKDWLVSSRSAM